MAQELEDEIARLADAGTTVTKLSVAGYSLGGLIARYCVGLLHARGLFERIAPVNFTAFASPFLGVRSPLPGFRGQFWNAFGSRTLSASGQQLFLIDTFRDTGRPLLSVLTDPESIFIKGLARFKNRALYANVQNDRSAPWFTTGVAAKDPYVDLSAVDMQFVAGYEPVVADPNTPLTPKSNPDRSLSGRFERGVSAATAAFPFYALTTLLWPVAVTGFLINAGYQTFQSGRRVRLHNEGKTFGMYRIPLMVEDALETIQAQAPHRHLTNGQSVAATKAVPEKEKREDPLANLPELDLLPEQFQMIEALDNVGFRKYPVLISLARHSHAAIVVRYKRDRLKEGFTVIKHWVDEEFEI